MTNFEQELRSLLKNYRTHRVGTHSDDYGGESDNPCLCDLNEALLKLHREEGLKRLLKLKEEMKMHTVPEGTGLISRSYLNNSIDFMVGELEKSDA